jgi:hypothetical protein
MKPLKAGSLVPAKNPLWVMLNMVSRRLRPEMASLAPAPVPATVVVNGQTWPVMPPSKGARVAVPALAQLQCDGARLIDAFGD